jgi:hypothetical protein
MLNGIQAVGFGPMKTLEVNAHGVLYMQDTSGNGILSRQHSQNSTGPQSGPVPIDIHFNPTIPTVSVSTAIGTTICTIAPTTSDGSTFDGTIGVFNITWAGAVLNSGVWNLLTTAAVPGAGGTVASIRATQNGATYNVAGLDIFAS